MITTTFQQGRYTAKTSVGMRNASGSGTHRAAVRSLLQLQM
jgi:hypothetical protein